MSKRKNKGNEEIKKQLEQMTPGELLIVEVCSVNVMEGVYYGLVESSKIYDNEEVLEDLTRLSNEGQVRISSTLDPDYCVLELNDIETYLGILISIRPDVYDAVNAKLADIKQAEAGHKEKLSKYLDKVVKNASKGKLSEPIALYSPNAGNKTTIKVDGKKKQINSFAATQIDLYNLAQEKGLPISVYSPDGAVGPVLDYQFTTVAKLVEGKTGIYAQLYLG